MTRRIVGGVLRTVLLAVAFGLALAGLGGGTFLGTEATGSLLVGAVGGVVIYLIVWLCALRVGLPRRGRRWAVLALGAAALGPLIYPLGPALFLPGPALPIIPVQSDVATRSTLTLSAGERMNVWHLAAPEMPKGVVLYVPGGPGGRVWGSTLSVLDRLRAAGYAVHAYDHYGGGYSQFTDPDPELLTIADEVRRLREVALAVGEGRPVHLVGHSYAGMVLGRFLAEHSSEAATVTFMDTSGLFDLASGNLKDRAVMNEALPAPPPGAAGKGSTTVHMMDGAPTRRYLAAQPLHLALRRALAVFWRDERGVPFVGRPDEIDAGFAYMTYAAVPSLPEPTVLSGTGMITQLVLTDAAAGEDYADALIAADTPPALVLHPESGVVGWRIHKDYESFLDEVSFVPVPGAGHAVWTADPAFVVGIVADFLAGDLDPQQRYEGLSDPFGAPTESGNGEADEGS